MSFTLTTHRGYGFFFESPLLAALLLFICLGCNAQPPMVPAGATLQITDRVYIIPDQRVSLVPNVGIIIGKRSVMVVDTGMGPKNTQTVLREVRKITDKPIDYLAITHFHPEHGMGAQAFPAHTRIVVPRAQKQELAEKGEDYIAWFSGMSPQIADLLEDVNLVTPHIAFDNRMEIDLGGLVVHLLYFHRAHTRGDMFVFLPEQKLLFGGDIVLDRFFPILPDIDASPTGWLKTLRELKSLRPEIVIPGHGDIGDVSLIDQLAIYLTAMQVQVTAQVKNGASLEQARAALVPQFARSYAHWENPQWINNAIERFYVELQ